MKHIEGTVAKIGEIAIKGPDCVNLTKWISKYYQLASVNSDPIADQVT